MIVRYLILILSFLVFCEASDQTTTVREKTPLQRLSFLTFNVENLFDATDDPRKNDETFLPLSQKKSKRHKRSCAKSRLPKWKEQCLKWNWDETVVDIKLKRIGQVLKQIGNGSGADFVLLQEVENKAILQRLVTANQLDYEEIVLIEGLDIRGIDVAILSKFPLKQTPQLHTVSFKKVERERLADSRGILEATFELPSKRLITIFNGHFPAPFHPMHMRKDSLQKLNELLQKLPVDRLVIAGGDFNISKEEDAKENIFKFIAEPYWQVAHREGCASCRGTAYYAKNDTWSFLDILMVRRYSGTAEWQWDPKTVKVINTAQDQTDKAGRPQAFDPVTKMGVSDHWPLNIEIFLKSN